MPQLSVVMSVYNGERFVAEAIESILAQTFADFEFIIINDGSTDGTQGILDTYTQKDSRIIIISQENRGLTKSLNRGIQLAKGKYIARMDADDISPPSRFASELVLFESNNDAMCIGTHAIIIDEQDHEIKKVTIYEKQLQNIHKRNCLIHGTLIFKREALQAVHGYDENIFFAQDYDLLLRLIDHYSIQSIKIVNECLYALRRTNQNISTKKFFHQLYYTALSQYRSTLRRFKKTNLSSPQKLYIFLKHYLYVFTVIYTFGIPTLLRILKIIP